MAFVDVHAHIDHAQFKNDLDEVIDRARKAGVVSIINNGLDVKTNRKTLELAEKYDIVKAALGFYPGDALQVSEEVIDNEIKFILDNKNKITAIGEIGLDNHWIKGKLDEQKKTFSKLIELAEKINKPILVHSRSAEQDCIDFLESTSIKKVIVHCFSGNTTQVKRIADNGWFFSIPCNVVRSKHFQKIVKNVNINQLFTETDAPYLAPEKDQRSESSFVTQSIKKIAELKGFEEKEVENNIFLNYKRLFE